MKGKPALLLLITEAGGYGIYGGGCCRSARARQHFPYPHVVCNPDTPLLTLCCSLKQQLAPVVTWDIAAMDVSVMNSKACNLWNHGARISVQGLSASFVSTTPHCSTRDRPFLQHVSQLDTVFMCRPIT